MPDSQDPLTTPDSTDRLDGHVGDAGDWVQHHVGQPVSVYSHRIETGTGVIDDMTEDGSIVWVRFNGAPSRRMFLRGDPELIRPRF
jgi:hypothetical protein